MLQNVAKKKGIAVLQTKQQQFSLAAWPDQGNHHHFTRQHPVAQGQALGPRDHEGRKRRGIGHVRRAHHPQGGGAFLGCGKPGSPNRKTVPPGAAQELCRTRALQVHQLPIMVFARSFLVPSGYIRNST